MVKFTSPPDREYFNHLVWDLVRQVPQGKVTTYGFIAGLIPPPAGMEPRDYQAWGARWVGGAMAACPAGVPWQRVISAQGKISLRPGSGGTRQRELLEALLCTANCSGKMFFTTSTGYSPNASTT